MLGGILKISEAAVNYRQATRTSHQVEAVLASVQSVLEDSVEVFEKIENRLENAAKACWSQPAFGDLEQRQIDVAVASLQTCSLSFSLTYDDGPLIQYHRVPPILEESEAAQQDVLTRLGATLAVAGVANIGLQAIQQFHTGQQIGEAAAWYQQSTVADLPGVDMAELAEGFDLADVVGAFDPVTLSLSIALSATGMGLRRLSRNRLETARREAERALPRAHSMMEIAEHVDVVTTVHEHLLAELEHHMARAAAWLDKPSPGPAHWYRRGLVANMAMLITAFDTTEKGLEDLNTGVTNYHRQYAGGEAGLVNSVHHRRQRLTLLLWACRICTVTVPLVSLTPLIL